MDTNTHTKPLWLSKHCHTGMIIIQRLYNSSARFACLCIKEIEKNREVAAPRYLESKQTINNRWRESAEVFVL